MARGCEGFCLASSISPFSIPHQLESGFFTRGHNHITCLSAEKSLLQGFEEGNKLYQNLY